MATIAPESVTSRFPRAARVRARAEFDLVFTQGRRVASPLLALHWHADQHDARLGLAVSRKVDPHAVGRNRIKRALREQFRQLRADLAPGRYVIVARAAAAKADSPAIRSAFISQLRKLGALPLSATTGTMPPAVLSSRHTPTLSPPSSSPSGP